MAVGRAATRRWVGATVVAVAIGTAGLAATPAGAAPAWTVQQHPRPPAARTGVFLAVACFSASNCTAVGDFDNATSERTLVEHWNGSSWALQSSRNVSSALTNRLLGIACPTASGCIAVGMSDYKPLAQRWNGSTWSLLAMPLGSNGQLSAVSCTSLTNCIAVGDNGNQPIAMRWNGTSWSGQSMPHVASGSSLRSVSCAIATDCKAVGSQPTTPGSTDTLVERWNGSNWALQTDAVGGSTSALNSVRCISTGNCYAVGSLEQSTLVEHWNGTSWSMQASPSPGKYANVLAGVDCSSGSACTAAGYKDTDNGRLLLIEHWNGGTWSTQAAPEAHLGQNEFAAVSCAGVTCTAVGHVDEPLGLLVERTTGSGWSQQPAATPMGDADGILLGASCGSATSCVAVGSYIERWNGSSWALQTFPVPAGDSGLLNGVSCLSATSCFAVGSSHNPARERTLVERWNGSTWSMVASPNPTGLDASLQAISCTSASWCMAVGAKGPHDGSGLTVFAERWNGSAWSIVNVPGPPGPTTSRLLGVSCTSASNCLTVGFSDDGPTGDVYAARWNGASWSTSHISAPATGTLRAIDCVSANNCTAVGSGSTSSDTDALIEHWNGSSWSVQKAAGVFGRYSGVSCVTASNCTAVGSTDSNETLAVHLVGSTWSAESPVNPPQAFDNELDGVDCPSASLCIAAGFTERAYVDGGSATSSMIQQRS